MIMPMLVNVDIGYDGPELIDIESAALRPVHTLRIHDTADVSARSASSSHVRSLQVQQRKPGCHGDADADEDDCAGRDADAAIHAERENIAAQRTGNKLFVFSLSFVAFIIKSRSAPTYLRKI